MTAKEFREKDNWNKADFFKGEYDIDLNSIDEYAEAYYQAKLKLLGIANVRLSLPTGNELHNTMAGRNVLKAISFPIANKFNTHPEKVTDIVEQIINNLNRQ